MQNCVSVNVGSHSDSEEFTVLSNNKKKAYRYIWKDEVAQTREKTFYGDNTVPSSLHFEKPVEYFRYFLTTSVTDHIIEQSVLYSVQTRPSKPISLSAAELENFIGIVLYMSLVKLATSRSYWSAEFRVDKVADAMPVNRFEEIKKSIHFADNAQSSTDKLKKIRPILNFLQEHFATIPLEENLRVDDTI